VLAKEKGFTQTHMFLIDISDIIFAAKAEKILEQANILVNRNMLPQDSSFLKPSGLRIGTPEITRIGAKEKDMQIIASFFHKLFIENRDPQKIYREVIKFRKTFKNIQYCYPAYE
jgi:glycine hydroxymethyltransferase